MKKVVCKKCGSTDVSVTIAVNPNDITTIAEYCRRDETTITDGWCNRCLDNTELAFTLDEEPSDPWLCAECGSMDIQQKVWVDTNTGDIVDWDNVGKSECYCQNCEANTLQIRRSELLRTIHEWLSQRTPQEQIGIYFKQRHE